ncbi:hydroxymethylglutaryl-CoA lyase [Egicoccus halophilus]|uniref:hydroxymethylglutaryl-CoA lyase n=1 Tax=Egicoccus halophilus TaxID=1670830 RepID=A0A8J3A749_9ACTN|nr:hydroxymethylglutaryl-CoA lyase [Egicoccus halophilus]GGI05120.1 hydroxymethylglutaryl-CoA lyase [Egicoccus halophilus]
MDLPEHVTIVEVGPRDGLQNEPGVVPTDVKVAFVDRLARTGLSVVEATSFVSPRWVPQLADAAEVLADIERVEHVRYPVLVPNERGLERALEADVAEVAVFGAASEAFSAKNLNRTIDESLEMFRPVVARARDAGLRVRGYVSTVCGCPYQGEVPVADVVRMTVAMLELGCDEISLGDTIGVGAPGQVQDLLAAVTAEAPVQRLAVHMHDTYGQGLANTLAAFEAGVTIADSAAGGLGGCPYAPGAKGNLATEDLVYALHGSGVTTGVDLDALVDATAWMAQQLGRPPVSRVAEAMLAKRER